MMENTEQAATVPGPELLSRYGTAGPRYTSYPTAPWWTDAFGPAQAAEALRGYRRAAGGLSLYVHIPFCERRCSFCACNVVISRDHDKAGGYLDLLEREMDLALSHLAGGGAAGQVVQVHFGGGTPTWLSPAELHRLCRMIASRFSLAADREQSCEVHPVVTSAEQIDVLVECGLNRLSMGVQDFNPAVQAAVNRHQTYEQTARLIHHARQRAVSSVNVDLIYGLPRQTLAGFARTIEQVIELQIDRVALYNFAYLPERVQAQQVIDPADLPPPELRTALFTTALEQFARAGYRQIGLDHFARGGNELATALDDGSLQRNFMGYTTRAGSDLLSFGVSSISRVGPCFWQNSKELLEHREDILAGRLPVERGLRLSDDDLLREQIIQRLMCFARVDLAALCTGPQGQALLESLCTGLLAEKLSAMQNDGLLRLEDGTLHVEPRGRYFLRNIAMLFDAYLGRTPPPQTIRGKTIQTRFSQTV